MLFSRPSGQNRIGNYYRSWRDDRKAAQRSAQIDRQIEQDGKRPTENEHNVLLLGLSGSGKSTIVKQMRITHQGGFSHDTKIQYRKAIYSNLLESAQAVAAALHRFEVEPADPSNVQALEQVLEYDLDAELWPPTRPSPLVFPSQPAEAIHRLWQDRAVQEFVDSYGSQFYLMDNASYFFAEARRITSADYVPAEKDILQCKQRDPGVVETVFSIPSLSIRLFEVGSQGKLEKWVHYFESVTSVVFCTALSDYDQISMGAGNQNRISESLALFDLVVNSRWFLRTSVILFLNKIDIFRDKLRRIPLEQYFEEYTGGPDANEATDYVMSQFVQANRVGVTMYAHITQAMDSSNIRFMFSAVTDTIIQNALKDIGIL